MNASIKVKVLFKWAINLLLIGSICTIIVGATNVSDDHGKEAWVFSIYETMGLEERAGLLVWIEVDCQSLSELNADDFRGLKVAGIVVKNCDIFELSKQSSVLKSLPVMATAYRSEIAGLEKIANPHEYQSEEHRRLYNDVIRKELALTGLDLFWDENSFEKINLNKYSGNQRLLKRYLTQNDGIIISQDLQHVYHETINLVRTGLISEKLLENKIKKVLEVKYDHQQLKKTPVPDNAMEQLGASINSLRTNESFSWLSENKVDFRIALDDKLGIIGESSMAENIYQITRKHVPATFWFPSADKLPKDPELYFNKLIVIGSLDSTMYSHRIAQLDQADVLQISQYFVDEHGSPISFLHYPFEDRISLELLASSIIEDVATAESTVLLSENHYPEEAQMSSSVLGEIDSVIHGAIKEKAFPGCQVLVAREGKVVFSRNYGFYSYDSIFKVENETVYDLASVTKVAGTTLAVMRLVEEGKIDIERKVSVYLEELQGTNKRDLIIKDVLLHQSGLYSYIPLWKIALKDERYKDFFNESYNEQYNLQIADNIYSNSTLQDSIWSWILQTPLIEKEDNQQTYPYRYSDLGFYILKELIERVTSQTLDEYVYNNFYRPMGLYNITYNPLCKLPISTISPTEMDTHLRHALIVGEVHDRNAALRGGVEGHAGLFSNALELAKLMQMMLNNGSYSSNHFFDKDLIDYFTTSHYPGNRRGLGWDKSSRSMEDNTSDLASSATYGHSGFTGTGIWVDPEFDLIYVFLSNRVHPDADNNKISELRVRENVQDIIYRSILN